MKKEKPTKETSRPEVEMSRGEHYRAFLVTKDPRGVCYIWPYAASAFIRFDQSSLSWTTDGRFFGAKIKPWFRRLLIGSRDGALERVMVVD